MMANAPSPPHFNARNREAGVGAEVLDPTTDAVFAVGNYHAGTSDVDDVKQMLARKKIPERL